LGKGSRRQSFAVHWALQEAGIILGLAISTNLT
jgi:hypothetical protein